MFVVISIVIFVVIGGGAAGGGGGVSCFVEPSPFHVLDIYGCCLSYHAAGHVLSFFLKKKIRPFLPFLPFFFF